MNDRLADYNIATAGIKSYTKLTTNSKTNLRQFQDLQAIINDGHLLSRTDQSIYEKLLPRTQYAPGTETRTAADTTVGEFDAGKLTLDNSLRSKKDQISYLSTELENLIKNRKYRPL